MKPIPALMLKFIPVKCKAIIPPIKAKGTLSIVSIASFTLPKVINRIKKITNKHIGIMLAKVLFALCWFSNSPFQLILKSSVSFIALSTFSCASFIVLPRSLSLTENFTVIYLSLLSL